MTARGAHLVGGLAAADNREAMTLAATVLGGRLRALPDGETGDRNQWIGWQIASLLRNRGFSMAEAPKTAPLVATDETAQYAAMPQLVLADDAAIDPSTLGYSAAAIASFEVFRELRAAGVIPAAVRFQVSLPTPYAVVVAWGALGQMERFLELYKAALFAEVETIGDRIPAADLRIQWDVAVEVGVLEHAFAVDPALAAYERVINELVECVRAVPQGVEIGLHMCYGDYHHRHFKVPADLGLVTRMATDVWNRAKVDFVHMPVDREAGRRPEYFAPLASLPRMDLALGVIDYENDPEVIDQLVANADATGLEYAVATECGMARVGERHEHVTVKDLLEQHARVSAAL